MVLLGAGHPFGRVEEEVNVAVEAKFAGGGGDFDSFEGG
jgi:hypothetical protein